MKAKIRPAVFACPKNHQFCCFSSPRTKRPQFRTAQAIVGSRQYVWHPFHPVDQVQVSLVAQPARSGIHPFRKRRIYTQGTLAARIISAEAGTAVKIGRIRQNVIKALVPEWRGQVCKVRLHSIKTVACGKRGISRLSFNPDEPQTRDTGS